MRFITGLLVTGLLSSSVFKVGAVVPKSEVNDTIVDLRPLVYEQPFQRKADKITDAKWFQMTYVGVPLVIAGLSVKHGSEHFRQLREDFVPNFHYGYDDYLQYAPAVVMLGLKGFGVESRSSWGRMLVSDAFSVAIMASVVNTIKYTAHVRRPDKSNYKSFPSGHTATYIRVYSKSVTYIYTSQPGYKAHIKPHKRGIFQQRIIPGGFEIKTFILKNQIGQIIA